MRRLMAVCVCAGVVSIPFAVIAATVHFVPKPSVPRLAAASFKPTFATKVQCVAEFGEPDERRLYSGAGNAVVGEHWIYRSAVAKHGYPADINVWWNVNTGMVKTIQIHSQCEGPLLVE